MSELLAGESQRGNPPLEFAVAVWLGMPDDEIERGLREGWIRHPSAAAPRLHTEGPIPFPDQFRDGNGGEARSDDRTRIHAILRRLDGTLDAARFDAAWAEAGANDPARARAFRGFLARTLNVAHASPAEDGVPEPALAALEAAAAGASGRARFLHLDTMTGRDLETLARSDGGLRRALAAHENWALTGDRALAQLGDPEGRYDRFDRDTGEALLSDAWLGDRARHAAWRRAAAQGQALEVAGDGWRFIDRAAGDAVTLELRAAGDSLMHQVIFARDDGDSVSGGASTDRIHGGRGDDVLRGRAGDDLIEGGAGADILQGGSGRDHLSGQQGDDDLDGGAGRDQLEGGSGDDTLAGGRGDDLLRGGEGSDTYHFEQGDGTDIIDDAGGAIFIDDVALAGTMQRDGSGWRSDDGRYRVSLDDNDESALIITSTQDGDGGAADAIRVLGWTQGAFGITLGATDDPAEDFSESPRSDADLEDGRAPVALDDGRDDLSQSPPSSDIADNDAGLGADAAGSDAGSDATLAISGDVTDQPRRSLFDMTSLASDPLDTSTLVDFAAVIQVLENGWIPSPPDVDAPSRSEWVGLTPADLAEALAEGSDAADIEVGYPPVFDSRGIVEPPRPGDATAMARPELLLRATPA